MERRAYVTSRGVRLLLDEPQTAPERMRGLLGLDELGPDRGLLLRRTRSIHTVGMRFPILVTLLDGDLAVLWTRTVPPGRVVRPRARVLHVLELAAEVDVQVGDQLHPDARHDAEVPGAILPRLPPGGGCWYGRAPIV